MIYINYYIIFVNTMEDKKTIRVNRKDSSMVVTSNLINKDCIDVMQGLNINQFNMISRFDSYGIVLRDNLILKYGS